MKIATLDPAGSVEYVDVRHGDVFRRAVLPPLSCGIGDPSAPVEIQTLDYRNSGCVTGEDVPVWTVGGTPPKRSPRGIGVYRLGPRAGVRVLVSRLELASSRLRPSENAWGIAKLKIEAHLGMKARMIECEEGPRTAGDMVEFSVLAEGYEAIP